MDIFHVVKVYTYRPYYEIASYNFEELKEEMIDYLYELDDDDGKMVLMDLVFMVDAAKTIEDIPMDKFYKESRSGYYGDEKWVQIIQDGRLIN